MKVVRINGVGARATSACAMAALQRPAVALLVALALSACNKGRADIEHARAAHAAGDLTSALHSLELVAKDAPGSPELAEANSLAVTWILEAADAAKGPERARLLQDARRRDPQSGAAAARECKDSYDADAGWDALRTCLEKDLAGKTQVPADIVVPLRDALAEHDKEQAEKAALLASTNPTDWATLRTKYPASSEARKAFQKIQVLADQRTLCGHDWRVLDEIAYVGVQLPEQVSNTQGTNDGAHVVYFHTIANDVEEHLAALKAKQSLADQHPFTPAEAALQKSLHQDFSRLIEMNQRWLRTLRMLDYTLDAAGNLEVVGSVEAFLATVRRVQDQNTNDAKQVGDDDVNFTNVCLALGDQVVAPGFGGSASAVDGGSGGAVAAPPASAANAAPSDATSATSAASVASVDTGPNDGTDAHRPTLPATDAGFVDKRGGWGWSDRCWVHLRAEKWGWAKAECDEGMRLGPASPQPRSSLLYNEGLIAKSAGDTGEARRYFNESLDLRENAEVRGALEALDALGAK